MAKYPCLTCKRRTSASELLPCHHIVCSRCFRDKNLPKEDLQKHCPYCHARVLNDAEHKLVELCIHVHAADADASVAVKLDKYLKKNLLDVESLFLILLRLRDEIPGVAILVRALLLRQLVPVSLVLTINKPQEAIVWLQSLPDLGHLDIFALCAAATNGFSSFRLDPQVTS